MASISIPTSFNIDLHFDTAGFLRRLAAWAIDLGVQLLYIYVIFRIIDPVLYRMHRSHYTSTDTWAVVMLVLLPISVYHLVSEVALNGQSIGKKIAGIKVVSLHGGRPGIGQLLIRWLLRLSDTWLFILLFTLLSVAGNAGVEKWMIAVFGLLFLLTDVLLIAFGKKSQRTGDILAGTLLIKTNTRATIADTMFQEVAAGYTPVFPQVMRMSDRDLNIVNKIVRLGRRRKNPEADMAAAKIKAHLGIETPLDSFTFLQTILKDYNYLSAR